MLVMHFFMVRVCCQLREYGGVQSISTDHKGSWSCTSSWCVCAASLESMVVYSL